MQLGIIANSGYNLWCFFIQSFGTSLFTGCIKRSFQNLIIDILFVNRKQDSDIIKVSHSGIQKTSCKYRLKLFRKNSLQIIRPQAD